MAYQLKLRDCSGAAGAAQSTGSRAVWQPALSRALPRNDRVALLADNSIEHLVCYFGVMAYGATVCTVHAEMNRNHLEQILAALKAQLILFDAELPQEELAHAPADACMALGKWHASASDTFFSAVRACVPQDGLSQTEATDDAVILFTSGTSDRPKGALLTYRELLCNALATAEGFGITGQDRIYDFRSFNCCSAQILSALAPLACGGTLVLG